MNDLQKIKFLVEKEFKIEDISTEKRNYQFSVARWFYCKLAREHTDMTTKKIGEQINRDHSTVVYALKNIPFELQYNKDLQTKYDSLEIIVMSEINKQTVEDIDNQIEILKSRILKLETKKQKLSYEFTNSKFKDQKNEQIFWS